MGSYAQNGPKSKILYHEFYAIESDWPTLAIQIQAIQSKLAAVAIKT